ncbi:GGDEF domain-containing protein [Vreelandella massiliensis]|uniref:GGDEF domain-containing protein n=1 Tax=Vreelandella massiliensis TaxID=1816686 RepID=UPI001F487FAD|nr:GGDEF domain-containing protein [Halomonas massiliensis]
MIRRLCQMRSGWLWLSLASFSTLVLLVIYDMRLVTPEIDRYFSQQDNVTGHQLATRSRMFLHDTLEALLTETPSLESASMSLDIAYGFLDIDVYRERYACTERSLSDIDALQRQLMKASTPEIARIIEALLPVLECLTDIEIAQRVQRSATVNAFVDEARQHQTLLLIGTLIVYLLGLIFWWFHEKQRRATEKASRESLRWMTKALRDPLTGVGNRDALYQDIAEQPDERMGLLLIDIDYFKPYNDCLGHPEGDRLLRRLTHLIEQAMGEEATLYRMGGDEFAVLMNCNTRETLQQRCAALVDAVTREAITHPDSPISTMVTLSGGGVWFCPADTGFEHAYAAADAALYRIKQAGRDGWEVSHTGTSSQCPA